MQARYVLGLDPGATSTGCVIMDPVGLVVKKMGDSYNEDMVGMINYVARRKTEWNVDHLAIEFVHVRGQIMSSELIQTIYWTGRFVEAWSPREFSLIDRKDVKMLLCGRSTAQNTHVRAALLALFPQTGGGAIPAIGTKKDPGPLYGLTGNHQVAAIGVVLAHHEECKQRLFKKQKALFS